MLRYLPFAINKVTVFPVVVYFIWIQSCRYESCMIEYLCARYFQYTWNIAIPYLRVALFQGDLGFVMQRGLIEKPLWEMERLLSSSVALESVHVEETMC